MRKTTKLLSALMMVAALLTACQVESLEKLDTVHTVKFSAVEAEATRTVFASSGTGTKLPVLWTSNQDVRIFPSQFSSAINAGVVPSSDQKTASFTGEMTFSATSRSAFYLLSPASVFSRYVSDKIVEINLPSSQTPTATSVDENAQVLVASTPLYRPVPATVTLNPTHLTAYIALRLTDFTAAGKNPTVEVTSASAVLSGKAQYNYDDGTLTPDSESSSKRVSAPVLSASKPVFLACFPAQVAGTKMLIRVKGLSGTLNKEITIPSDKNLTSGTVAVLTVSMAQTVPVTGVSVTPTTLSLQTGQTGSLTATVSPSNATNKTVSWSSSNTNVATVSSTGVVTAVAAGTATITATTADGGKTATCAVTVTAATVEPTGVSVSPTSLNLKINKTSTLTATVTPSDATDKTVTWSSSNIAVATVSSSGVVSAKAVGTATITATTVNGLKATCEVTVPNSLMKIDFSARANPGYYDYNYDASENAFHISKNSDRSIYYWATWADGSESYFSSGDLKLEVISGSGVTVSSNTSIRCTAAGQTAVIKVSSQENPAVYATMTVKTWDPATSVTMIEQYDVNSNRYGIAGWVKENTTARIQVRIEPSTARQKAVVLKAENSDGWTISRYNNTNEWFDLKAPAVNGSTVSAYTSKAMTLTIIDQCGSGTGGAVRTFTPTNIDLTQPKPLDYISYSSVDKRYCIVDGGLRIHIKGSDGHSCKDFYSVSKTNEVYYGYSAGSPYVPVGIVTGFYPGQIPQNTVASSSFPEVIYQLENDLGSVKFTSLTKGSFHGFAIALNETAQTYWSANNGNVPSSEHWNSSYGTITYPSSANDLNAFDLTVLAAYHNGALASNWCIYPVDRTWRYPDPGFEYDVRAWPSIDIYKMRPWVTPTVANYLMIRDSDGTFYKGKFVAALNERIENVGGTKIFDTASDHWTINMSDASNAMSITIGVGNGTVKARPKQDVLFFRPFMVF